MFTPMIRKIISYPNIIWSVKLTIRNLMEVVNYEYRYLKSVSVIPPLKYIVLNQLIFWQC